MSSKFTLTIAAFNVALAAVTKGTKLDRHASAVVKLGYAPSVKAFCDAYTLKYAAEAVNVSIQAITVPTKPSNSKALKAFAADVDRHNASNPEAPCAAGVKADGSFYLVRLPRPRQARNTSGGLSENSNVSANTVALACCKADDYDYERQEYMKDNGKPGYKYFLNGEQVAGPLVQALFALCGEGTATRTKLLRYGKKEKKN